MIEPPQIVQTESRAIAFIPITASWEEMPKVMGPGIAELLAVITAQGMTPTGEIYTHHLRRPTDTFAFKICVPVAGVVLAAGRVQPGEWPSMKMARTVYQGPYEGLENAWPEFFDWITANGLTTSDELWEGYTVGPHSHPDSSAWRTELSLQVVN
jgi:effector-binding domain-containing protein